MIESPTSLNSHLAIPRLIINDGTLEGLKWIALLLMTGDHINKYLFNSTLPYLFELGRVAMPLFIFVLAYNLARPNQLEKGVYQRAIKRLTTFGVLASVPFIALGYLYDGWWPLNILFTLLALTIMLYLIEREYIVLAVLMFIFLGSIVEYWWPALLLGLVIWSYVKSPTLLTASLAVIVCASLSFINGNMWALSLFPIIFIATLINLRIPRVRWAFYAYYPLHLGALWLIRIPMSHAGYLFF